MVVGLQRSSPVLPHNLLGYSVGHKCHRQVERTWGPERTDPPSAGMEMATGAAASSCLPVLTLF